MRDVNEAIDYYIARARDRGADDNVFFSLIELDPPLSRLIAEAEKHENRSIRAFLTEVIWQLREPEAIDYLGTALSDPEPGVWKQALDGLVVIGGPTAIAWIGRAIEQARAGNLQNGLTEEWLREALDQICASDADSS